MIISILNIFKRPKKNQTEMWEITKDAAIEE